MIAETTHLESEKVKKEAEVKTLIEDNVRLRVLLDKKEAQLLAMNVQCKWMSLKRSGHIASAFTLCVSQPNLSYNDELFYNMIYHLFCFGDYEAIILGNFRFNQFMQSLVLSSDL